MKERSTKPKWIGAGALASLPVIIAAAATIADKLNVGVVTVCVLLAAAALATVASEIRKLCAGNREGVLAPPQLMLTEVRVLPNDRPCTLESWIEMRRRAGTDVPVDSTDPLGRKPQKLAGPSELVTLDVIVTNTGGSTGFISRFCLHVDHLGYLDYSASYDLDMGQIHEGEELCCETAQTVEPGDVDRFAVRITARGGKPRFRFFRLTPSIVTPNGKITGKSIAVAVNAITPGPKQD